MCSWGPWLLSSLVPLGERLCFNRLIPTPHSQAPAGGLKALTGVLRGAPGPHLPLCSGWVRPWAPAPLLIPDLGIWTRDCPRHKPLRTSPTVQTFLNPAPHPCPVPLPRSPMSPASPSSPSPGLPVQLWAGPGGPACRTVVTETTPCHPPVPQTWELRRGGASRGHGSGTGRRVGLERNQETRHVYGKVSKVQAKRGEGGGPGWPEEKQGRGQGWGQEGEALTPPRR